MDAKYELKLFIWGSDGGIQSNAICFALKLWWTPFALTTFK